MHLYEQPQATSPHEAFNQLNLLYHPRCGGYVRMVTSEYRLNTGVFIFRLIVSVTRFEDDVSCSQVILPMRSIAISGTMSW